MALYPVPQPIDRANNPMLQFPPAFVSQARYDNENATASSVMTLTDNTTVIEVTALGVSAVLKWIPTTDTTASVISAAGTANYDHVIPAGNLRRFVIPIERALPAPSIQGINKAMGLYNRVAIKSTGIGSVLTSEF